MFTLPDLPYSFDALEPYIDKLTMEIHHAKHHAAYVNNLNEALRGHEEFLNMEVNGLLRSLDKVPQEVRTKVRNNAGGHANHSLFWTIMAPASQAGLPQGKLLGAINSTFGDLSSFKEKFTVAALARFGSGWAWLVVPSTGSGLEIVDTPIKTRR